MSPNSNSTVAGSRPLATTVLRECTTRAMQDRSYEPHHQSQLRFVNNTRVRVQTVRVQTVSYAQCRNLKAGICFYAQASDWNISPPPLYTLRGHKRAVTARVALPNGVLISHEMGSLEPRQALQGTTAYPSNCNDQPLNLHRLSNGVLTHLLHQSTQRYAMRETTH